MAPGPSVKLLHACLLVIGQVCALTYVPLEAKDGNIASVPWTKTTQKAGCAVVAVRGLCFALSFLPHHVTGRLRILSTASAGAGS